MHGVKCGELTRRFIMRGVQKRFLVVPKIFWVSCGNRDFVFLSNPPYKDQKKNG